jgi:hypothetical protein
MTGSRRFEILPYYARHAPGGWLLLPEFRRIPVILGAVVAGLASAHVALTLAFLPSESSSATDLFDAAVAVLAAAWALDSYRGPRRAIAESITLDDEGVNVAFTRSRYERLGWTDPELEIELRAGRRVYRRAEIEVYAMMAKGWRYPASLSPEAYDAILEESRRRGLSIATERMPDPPSQEVTRIRTGASGAVV